MIKTQRLVQMPNNKKWLPVQASPAPIGSTLRNNIQKSTSQLNPSMTLSFASPPKIKTFWQSMGLYKGAESISYVLYFVPEATTSQPSLWHPLGRLCWRREPPRPRRTPFRQCPRRRWAQAVFFNFENLKTIILNRLQPK